MQWTKRTLLKAWKTSDEMSHMVIIVGDSNDTKRKMVKLHEMSIKNTNFIVTFNRKFPKFLRIQAWFWIAL